jgi:hypothetical protein
VWEGQRARAKSWRRASGRRAELYRRRLAADSARREASYFTGGGPKSADMARKLVAAAGATDWSPTLRAPDAGEESVRRLLLGSAAGGGTHGAGDLRRSASAVGGRTAWSRDVPTADAAGGEASSHPPGRPDERLQSDAGGASCASRGGGRRVHRPRGKRGDARGTCIPGPLAAPAERWGRGGGGTPVARPARPGRAGRGGSRTHGDRQMVAHFRLAWRGARLPTHGTNQAPAGAVYNTSRWVGAPPRWACDRPAVGAGRSRGGPLVRHELVSGGRTWQRGRAAGAASSAAGRE